jgi:hypothetical protein
MEILLIIGAIFLISRIFSAKASPPKMDESFHHWYNNNPN